MQNSYFIQSLLKQCSNNVQIQTLFVLCSYQLAKIQISFIVCPCPKVHHSKYIHPVEFQIKSILKNSNYVQLLFKIQTLFKLEFVQIHVQYILSPNFFFKNSNCVQILFQNHTMFKLCSRKKS